LEPKPLNDGAGVVKDVPTVLNPDDVVVVPKPEKGAWNPAAPVLPNPVFG
jgi:hypothetical protein